MYIKCQSQWPSGMRQLVCWDCGFESRQGHGCLSVVCCHVEVSATDRSNTLPTVTSLCDLET